MVLRSITLICLQYNLMPCFSRLQQVSRGTAVIQGGMVLKVATALRVPQENGQVENRWSNYDRHLMHCAGFERHRGHRRKPRTPGRRWSQGNHQHRK